ATVRAGSVLDAESLGPFGVGVGGIESNEIARFFLVGDAKAVENSGADGAIPGESAGRILARPGGGIVERDGQARGIVISDEVLFDSAKKEERDPVFGAQVVVETGAAFVPGISQRTLVAEVVLSGAGSVRNHGGGPDGKIVFRYLAEAGYRNLIIRK